MMYISLSNLISLRPFIFQSTIKSFSAVQENYNLITLVNFKSICNDFVKFIDWMVLFISTVSLFQRNMIKYNTHKNWTTERRTIITLYKFCGNYYQFSEFLLYQIIILEESGYVINKTFELRIIGNCIRICIMWTGLTLTY